ncbi:MAG TPA: DUF3052 family protein [Steroidobacteraceae bacterium]|nr:DUF3052 family protein [Steroidobacteraceae bacterium]
MAGYSGTPLAMKLGIREGSELYAVGAPSNYRKLLAPLPKAVRFSRRLTASTDVVHLFTRRRADVESYLREWYARLRNEGCVWVSWPKKSAGVATDVTEDVIRAVALSIGLVDVKVCAVDETWSGLKLVIRKINRNKRS